MATICPSGDWDCLNEHLSNIYNILITKLDSKALDGINALNKTWKATIDNTLESLQSTVETIESTLMNLNLSHSTLSAAFSRHTGLPAISGHAGLT